MLSGVVTDQRMKAQGNHVPNGPKEGIAEQHEQSFDAWRTQPHQGYGAATMSSAMSDPYMSSFYGGTYPYQAFGVSDGTWSNGGDPMTTFLSGYGGQVGHDYNIDGMFGPGGFGGFGQPGFSYGFPGSNDYAWGNSNLGRNKPYEYYRDVYGHDERNDMKPVEQGVQGLSIGGEGKKDQKENDGGHKENVSVAQAKKPTWANIASQPAKPQSKSLKKNMAPAPMLPGSKHMDIGTWEGKNGTKPIPPPPNPRPTWAGSRGGPQPHVQPAQPSNSQGVANASQNNHPVLEELKVRNEYNPKDFEIGNKGARFFVIKSYSEDDIHRSIKYEIWCSTEHGNKRLDQAFRDKDTKGPVYLFFSVNSSGHFCGMAQMMSAVDYSCSSSVWAQKKWKGQFKVKWIYVKDVPNVQLRQIRLENNENKPVTNSRDTQEIPFEKGKQVLKILQNYKHTTSIFDDFVHYEKRQEEEEIRRQQQQQTGAQAQPPPLPKEEREGRGRGRGGSTRN